MGKICCLSSYANLTWGKPLFCPTRWVKPCPIGAQFSSLNWNTGWNQVTKVHPCRACPRSWHRQMTAHSSGFKREQMFLKSCPPFEIIFSDRLKGLAMANSQHGSRQRPFLQRKKFQKMTKSIRISDGHHTQFSYERKQIASEERNPLGTKCYQTPTPPVSVNKVEPYIIFWHAGRVESSPFSEQVTVLLSTQCWISQRE